MAVYRTVGTKMLVDCDGTLCHLQLVMHPAVSDRFLARQLRDCSSYLLLFIAVLPLCLKPPRAHKTASVRSKKIIAIHIRWKYNNLKNSKKNLIFESHCHCPFPNIRKFLTKFGLGRFWNDRTRSNRFQVMRVQLIGPRVGPCMPGSETYKFALPRTVSCTLAMSPKGPSRVAGHVTLNTFCLSPTVFELHAEIWSHGCQTVTMRYLVVP